MEETTGTIDGQGFDVGIEAIDSLIQDAAAAIDEGDHFAALDGFRQALAMARRCFGENPELKQIENTIVDIDGLLDKQ